MLGVVGMLRYFFSVLGASCLCFCFLTVALQGISGWVFHNTFHIRTFSWTGCWGLHPSPACQAHALPLSYYLSHTLREAPVETVIYQEQLKSECCTSWETECWNFNFVQAGTDLQGFSAIFPHYAKYFPHSYLFQCDSSPPKMEWGGKLPESWVGCFEHKSICKKRGKMDNNSVVETSAEKCPTRLYYVRLKCGSDY